MEKVATIKKKVLITGVSGFISGHVVVEFLLGGYDVRGTVRKMDPSISAALLEEANKRRNGLSSSSSSPYSSSSIGSIELVEADLLDGESFMRAIEGCCGVVHTASPVLMNPKDPEKDLIQPALQGTLNVLKASEHEAKRLSSSSSSYSSFTIVLTSSDSAIVQSSHRRMPELTTHIYTEEDWNTTGDLKHSPYDLSKTLAEKNAWDFVSSTSLSVISPSSPSSSSLSSSYSDSTSTSTTPSSSTPSTSPTSSPSLASRVTSSSLSSPSSPSTPSPSSPTSLSSSPSSSTSTSLSTSPSSSTSSSLTTLPSHIASPISPPLLRLVTINPTFVFGPQIFKRLPESTSVIKDLMEGAFPLCPDWNWGIVDVRDVARSHYLAFIKEEVTGRYILNNKNLWLTEIASILRLHFPLYPIPRHKMPDFLLYLVGLFDSRVTISWIQNTLGPPVFYSNKKATNLLLSKKEKEGGEAGGSRVKGEGTHDVEEEGNAFLDIEETVVSTAQRMIELGLVKKRNKAEAPWESSFKLMGFLGVVGGGIWLVWKSFSSSSI